MDEEEFETDEVDEFLDWMVDTFQSNQSVDSNDTSPNADNQSVDSKDASPNADLSNYEVGLTGSQLDYITDGKNWHWF
jgi:hypothetical protein